jgi:hypothetical protein
MHSYARFYRKVNCQQHVPPSSFQGRVPGTFWIGLYVRSKVGLDVLENRKISCRWRKSKHLARSRCYIDCAVPVPYICKILYLNQTSSGIYKHFYNLWLTGFCHLPVICPKALPARLPLLVFGSDFLC